MDRACALILSGRQTLASHGRSSSALTCFLFCCSEVSTLKDLFGLASNGRHLSFLGAWASFGCDGGRVDNQCSCLLTRPDAQMSLLFRA